MDYLLTARCLSDEGRYAEALESLQSGFRYRDRVEGEILQAELLEKIGRVGDANGSIESLRKIRGLSAAQRSRCEFVLSRICSQHGDHDAETQHLQRAIELAREGCDIQQACWAQLRLLELVGDREGPESERKLLSALRKDITRIGLPTLTAALHLFVGVLEGKRGHISKALHHTRITRRILSTSRHAWFETWAYNNELALSLLSGELQSALSYADQAMASARRCGVPYAVAGVLTNLGNLSLATGDLEKAKDFLSRAADLLPRQSGQLAAAIQESFARMYLASGDLHSCSELLAVLESSAHGGNAAGLYVHRHAQLTQIALLARQGRLDTAKQLAERAIELARRSGDDYLAAKLTLLRAHLMAGAEKWQEVTTALDLVAPGLPSHPIELYASYEATLGMVQPETMQSSTHIGRANRTFESLGNRAAQIKLETPQAGSPGQPTTDSSLAVAEAVQGLAALFMFAGRPELLCEELKQILLLSKCVDAVHVAGQRQTGITVTQRAGAPGAGTPARRIAVSETLELAIEPRPEVESHATLNAIELLLSAALDLKHATAERQERQTVWPIEEPPLDEDESAVLLGKMHELMVSARKVARTSAAVLITGESGTGKEVLARAIHRYSARADKPFVPVNCTAVPRELLESQLFGHRRGAFTGAERDSLGMIRTARAGTLFLDEIGELGLEVQPKLLRFLESGEIAPLGEPTPQRVDVRIIAATNANLQEQVQAGRFRGDLFYRLNVIPLAIPPLRERRDEIPALVHHFVAKAAAEFGKGRIRVSENAMEHLILYRWPGNIRELHNELRRMVALAEPDAVLRPEVLSTHILCVTPDARRTNNDEIAVPLRQTLNAAIAQLEREMIQTALRTHNGRVEAAARALGISRKGLYLKRQRLGL